MKHLTQADYTRQPWKNGKGETVEMWRLENNGQLLVRISRATVTEDGPFSLFPGLHRNLTVLTGAGFRLLGADLDLRCNPLVPVAFPGEAVVTANDTQGQPSDDFNVMTADHLPHPTVSLLTDGHLPAGGLLALYGLSPAEINGHRMAPQDLILTTDPADVRGEILAVRLLGL